MRQPRRAGCAVTTAPSTLALLVLLPLLAIAGCTSDDPDDPGPSAASVTLDVTTVTGADTLDESTRSEVESAVAAVISDYVVEGFLGDFPRREFVQAFGSFTSGAARTAARDIDDLTATSVQDATSVVATRLKTRLSLLVNRADVVGATAAIDFAFDATMPDGSTREVTLTGRLMLEEAGDDWAVYGYVVSLDDGDTQPAEVEK